MQMPVSWKFRYAIGWAYVKNLEESCVPHAIGELVCCFLTFSIVGLENPGIGHFACALLHLLSLNKGFSAL